MISVEQFNKRRQEMDTFCAHNGILCTKIGVGTCEFQCELKPEHKNPHGMAHGGLLFTLVDMAGCWAAALVHGTKAIRPLVTQNASIHYLRPVESGTLTAKAETIKAGRNTALAQVDVYDEQGRHIVRGEVTAYYIGELCNETECFFQI